MRSGTSFFFARELYLVFPTSLNLSLENPVRTSYGHLRPRLERTLPPACFFRYRRYSCTTATGTFAVHSHSASTGVRFFCHLTSNRFGCVT